MTGYGRARIRCARAVLVLVTWTFSLPNPGAAQSTPASEWSVGLGAGFANVSHVNDVYPFAFGAMPVSLGPDEYPGEGGYQLDASVTRSVSETVHVSLSAHWGSSPFVLLEEANDDRLRQFGLGVEPQYRFLPGQSFRPLIGGYFGWRRMDAEQTRTRVSDVTNVEEGVFKASSWDIGWLLGFSQRISDRWQVEALGRLAWLNFFAVSAVAQTQITIPSFPTPSTNRVEVTPADADGLEASLRVRVVWRLP